MSTVTERLDSIGIGLDGLRSQVSSQDYRAARTLGLLKELLAVVRELAAGSDGDEAGPKVAVLTADEIASRRRSYVHRAIFKACKVPSGTPLEDRERLIVHALQTAGLTEEEIAEWQR